MFTKDAVIIMSNNKGPMHKVEYIQEENKVKIYTAVLNSGKQFIYIFFKDS